MSTDRPIGVQEEVWRELQQALSESIQIQQRAIAKAPTGQSGLVGDLQYTASGADEAELSWTYKNTGDYDQNSQVNISDLTVIGLNIGKSDSSPDWDKAQLADGDGNGLITIADVTPIGINFGNVVSGYSIRKSSSSQPEEFNEIDYIAQSLGTSLPGTPALRFKVSIDGLSSGDSLHVVAVDVADSSSGSISNDVIFTPAVRPMNLTASQGTLPGEVVLTWDPVENAGGYHIQRRQISLTIYDDLGETDAGVTTFSDMTTTAGVHRFYRVAALLDGGLSAWSDTAEGWSMALPATPTGLMASDGTVDMAISLGWNEVADADGYRLYRDSGEVAVAELALTEYLDNEIVVPGPHLYEVSSFNQAGESPRSNAVTGSAGVIPSAPTGLQASTEEFTSHVALSWDASEYADGYNIYRDDPDSLLATTDAVLVFEDHSLEDFNEHDYWISAYTVLGESAKTGPATGSRLLVAPEKPQNVIASQGTLRDAILISWDLDSTAAGYDIYRDGKGTPLASIGPVPSYQDTSLPDLETHSYVIVATNSAGSSPQSDAAAGFPDNRSNWWRFGRDNSHSSRAQAAGPASNSLAWSYPSGSWIRCNPVMAADGTVYFGNYDGELVALNPQGTQKWTYNAGADIYTAPAIGRDGTIYVGSHDFKVHAVNPDGTVKWTYTTAGIVRSSPTVDDAGRIIVGSQDNKLYCINANGSLAWTYTCGEEVRSSPAIAPDGTIYVGSGKDNQLNAINPDGTLKWKYNAGGWVRSSPAIAMDGTIYVGSSNGRLHAVNPDGTQKWEFAAADYIENCSPAIGADGRVYIGSGDDKLYCIDPGSGLEIWSYATGSDTDSSPAIDSAGVIYIGSDDFKLHAVNPNGTLKWSYTTGALVDSGPLVGEDGRIYFGSADGSLYCIGPVL